MFAVRPVLLAALILTAKLVCGAAAEDLGIRVPEGFEVSLYADDALAHDIFSMTIDARGRVVVAGAGYVKTLDDSDGDGRADRATLFSSLPASGAHGMYFDGPDLICTGDNAVLRLRDSDGDGMADGDPQIWTALRHLEHGANGLARGPDGCYYLICGNDAGVGKSQISVPFSPIADPHCGAVVRFSASGQPLDVVADGFRNPYDLDFDGRGHLLTVDSDGERDHHLPWYAPTRLFDIAQGRGHGWLLSGWTRSWNRPQSFFDSVERMVEIGRGSPTGLLVYRHRQFPDHYRGGVFSACWTLGRVYYWPLTPEPAAPASRLEVFMQTAGDTGFAPTDLAVGPAGDLFVAIGGRRTRGSVFRVRATGRQAADQAGDLLEHVLAADQPLASWSRARWTPAARELGKAAFEQAVLAAKLPTEQRVRAVEVLVELFGQLDAAWAAQVARLPEADLRARLAWAMGRVPLSDDSTAILTRLTADTDPRVERAAWESLAILGPIAAGTKAQPDWAAALNSRQRRVRAAAINVANTTGAASYQAYLRRSAERAREPAERLAAVWIASVNGNEAERRIFSDHDLRTCVQAYGDAKSTLTDRLEAVRLLQIGLGDLRTNERQAEVFSGYVGNLADQLSQTLRREIVTALAPTFPIADAELNRELARLLGMLGSEHAGLLTALTQQWTLDSSVEDDVHYLIVAALVNAPWAPAQTRACADCLLGLHAKLERDGQFPSRNWPLRVAELFVELCRHDAGLGQALVDNPAFGRPQHVLFVENLSGELRGLATARLWQRASDQECPVTPELVALVGDLPSEQARPLLVSQWEQVELRDAIVLALAKSPRAEDREKFVEALSSPQGVVVEKGARALQHFGVNCTSAEMAAALRALKQACSVPVQSEPRLSLLSLLAFWTEECSDVDDSPDPALAYVPWFKLFEQYYPSDYATLRASAGADAETWRRRLARVAWSDGDAARGRGVFERRACNRCHQVSGHLGPELKGAVARMSRDDLFTAIIEPSLEVSPTFHTTVIATTAGQVYHGLVVYESPESTLLQTGPDTTVRITNAEQSSARRSTQSLMPTGLLDSLSDGDLSDLYAYLKTLAGK